MNPPITLTMTEDQHLRLHTHLFPGDGKEAVAVILCARCDGDRRHRLLVRYIEEIPHAQCERTAVGVTWQTEAIEDVLDRAEAEQLSFMKIHSHPNGYPAFSPTDNKSDDLLLPMVRGSTGLDVPHGSAIMTWPTVGGCGFTATATTTTNCNQRTSTTPSRKSTTPEVAHRFRGPGGKRNQEIGQGPASPASVQKLIGPAGPR